MYNLSSLKDRSYNATRRVHQEFMRYLTLLYTWMGSNVQSVYADYILGALFYIEAICFVPTDPVLLLYCFERPHHALRFASIATCCSVLGGITSYYMGAYIWHYVGHDILTTPPLSWIISQELFTYLQELFQRYPWTALLIAGCMPVPFKATTFVAGICAISLTPFIICSTIIRGVRFFIISFAIQHYSDLIKWYIDRYGSIIVLIICGLIIVKYVIR